jgi:hypothetical protein
VEAVELEPPQGVEPVHWRLLTTHQAADATGAWQIVDWYRRRWTIEQFFRVLKTQGFRIEDSQLDSADTLLKLIAVAAKAAVITLHLVQARDGRSNLHASVAFEPSQIDALAALQARYKARTPRQNNPHPNASLAWAAWIIARLGGWDGYPSSRPPGPITFKHGLDYFNAFALALQLPFCSEVSALRDGLMRPSPERPCDGVGGLNALSSKSDGDAADFLDRPADQRWCGRVLAFAGRRRVVFFGTGGLARCRMAAIMAKASITRET